MAEILTPSIRRREFLRFAAGVIPAVSFHRSLDAAAPLADDGGRRGRLADTIRSYQLYGIHRTATEVDSLSGQWLARESSRAGAESTSRAFSLDKVMLEDSYVEAGGVRREALPFFDGSFTSEGGVTGRIGSPESGAPIALVSLTRAAIGSEGQSIAGLRRRTDLRAIVAVTEGDRPGLCPSNARAFMHPYGVPVLQVSSTAAGWLNELVGSGRELHCVADARRAAAAADNVLAVVRGGRPELPAVVVITPRSGWWYCASERGGGLACWLEILRTVADVRPDRTVRFVASSGHELGHLGLETFLREEQPLIKGASAWLHLGACIGAASGRTTLQSSSDEIEALAVAAFERAGARIDNRLARGTVPSGEARNIHEGGGRYVSLLGSSPHFHNPDDLWPEAVDIDALDRYAAAVVELTLRLARA
jgi:hypothetical protein